MKSLFIVLGIFFSGTVAHARPNYVNVYVPQALTNLGLNTTGWSTNSNACLTCHGVNAVFGDFNTQFGAAFFGQANTLFPGLLVANGADDMTQAQVQQVIQALLDVDSDGDTYTNRQEFIARTNVNDSLSNPASTAGGGGDTVCKTNPQLPQCQGQQQQQGATDDTINMADSDAAYQLNPGCAPQEQARSEVAGAQVAGFGPIASFLSLWFLPIFISIYRRRK